MRGKMNEPTEEARELVERIRKLAVVERMDADGTCRICFDDTMERCLALIDAYAAHRIAEALAAAQEEPNTTPKTECGGFRTNPVKEND